MIRLIAVFIKQRKVLKNKVHGEKTLGLPSKVVYHSLNNYLKSIRKEIMVLEERLTALVKDHQQSQLTLLKSIPGLGVKTAIMLIVMTDGLNRFENTKQLCSYAGITTIIRESGSSIRGCSRISKMGNQKLRGCYSYVVFQRVHIISLVESFMIELWLKGKVKSEL